MCLDLPDNIAVVLRRDDCQMYANGGESIVGDLVRRIAGNDEGVVDKLLPGGLNGEEVVQVRWTTLHEISLGSGIKMPKAPSVIPTRLLELVSRG